MPSTVPIDPQPQPGANDDLDDLFADLIGNDASNHTGKYANQASNEQPNDLDEEIKVARKRKPIARLDEPRLLSTAGIPKLRRIAKDDTRMRFRGKGNEFADMARLLNTYQLWLDDMFPKAKFLDGLAMIEKLGHKKKIQMYRKEWIDEGKPKDAYEDLDDLIASNEEQAHGKGITESHDQGLDHLSDAILGTPDAPANNAPSTEPNHGSNDNDEPDDDELDTLLGEAAAKQVTQSADHIRPLVQEGQDSDDQDDLDALLGEEDRRNNEPRSIFGGPALPKTVSLDNGMGSFADDEEAMADMDW